MKWSRKRWFVGATQRGYKVFSCMFEPTRETHGEKYLYCFGPYRTRKRAECVRQYQTI